MSDKPDYAELVRRLRALASVFHDRTTYGDTADAIEALVKERDEARERRDGALAGVVEATMAARALGYREGLEKAAEVAENDNSFPQEGNYIAEAIRALIPE